MGAKSALCGEGDGQMAEDVLMVRIASETGLGGMGCGLPRDW